MGQRVDDGQFDLIRAKEGGLDAMFFSLFVTEQVLPGAFGNETGDSADRCRIRAARTEHRQDRAGPERIRRRAHQQNGKDRGLHGSRRRIRSGRRPVGAAHALSSRAALVSAPGHNWANNFADSCCATAKWHGLNDRGRAVIREANWLGMVINISHGSDETIAQAIHVSSDPLLATHHGLRSFNNIPRTMPDELLKKLAAKGGVIGFQIGNEFHNVKVFKWRTEHAGKPFWDTTDIGRKEDGMTIEEIDKLAAPQFPMVGIAAPEDLKFTPYAWLGVVERATNWWVKTTSCSDRFRRRPDPAVGLATSATCRCSPTPC